MARGIFDWPTTGYISQDYGCTGYWVNPPRGDCPHFHDGIDIAGGSGTPVRAAGSGVVAFIGYNPWESVPAFMVVIAHGGGTSSLYAHMLPQYPVSQGQVVRKGQVIGYMGNTGGCLRHAPSLGGLAGRRLAARQPARLPVGRRRTTTASRARVLAEGAQRSLSTQTWPP